MLIIAFGEDCVPLLLPDTRLDQASHCHDLHLVAWRLAEEAEGGS